MAALGVGVSSGRGSLIQEPQLKYELTMAARLPTRDL